jgi:proline iminopeptidase
MIGLLAGAHTPPIKDARGKVVPGSIAVMEKVMLGGAEQWIVIRGHSTANPILLYLHGGPGGDLGALQRFNRGLEERFLVVYWVQRGAGKSYASNLPPESMTPGQFVADARELVLLLLKRFGQEKVFVVGQSWGTGFGLELAQRYPELIHAYVGVNQTIDRAAEEERTYDLVTAEAQRRGDRKALSRLREIGRPQSGLYSTMDHLFYVRGLTRRWNMITHDPAIFRKWGMSILFAPEVGWSDLPKFLRGTIMSMKVLWPEFCHYNFLEQISEMKVPVYLVAGRHDPYMSAELAARWLEQVRAPAKELFVFERSGHIACYEEPERFNDLMISRVLRQTAGAVAV